MIGLEVGRQRYGFFTNAAGGIEDDLMFANRGDHLFLVVNAGCKEADVARLRGALEPDVTVEYIEDRALLALQGPAAESALAKLAPEVADMRFMDVATVTLNGVECWVSRSGYTGEDGYEISVPEQAAVGLARALLSDEQVEPIGLGRARCLRLEAGLCLYGHDIDAATSPVEAALTWAIQKVRRAGGAPGWQLSGRGGDSCPVGRRRGAQARWACLPEGRAPMREGTEIFAGSEGGERDWACHLGCFWPDAPSGRWPWGMCPQT